MLLHFFERFSPCCMARFSCMSPCRMNEIKSGIQCSAMFICNTFMPTAGAPSKSSVHLARRWVTPFTTARFSYRRITSTCHHTVSVSSKFRLGVRNVLMAGRETNREHLRTDERMTGGAWQAKYSGARAKAEDAGSLKAAWAACHQTNARPQAAAVARHAATAQLRCPHEGAAAAYRSRINRRSFRCTK